MTSSTPVSAALKADVLGSAVKHGAIVVWLDRDDDYGAFVADLAARYRAGEVSVPVVAHQGSFLETLLALEGLADGHTQQALIVHVPGHTEDTILGTPLLELYEVGTRYRMALDRLVHMACAGRATPAETAALLEQPDLTLAAADAWLARHMGAGRGDLAAFLEQSGLVVVTRDLLVDGALLVGRVQGAADLDTLADFLERQTGMDAAWRAFMGPAGGGADALGRLAEAYAGWLLAVEYAWDLRRDAHLPEVRRLKGLSRPLVERCQERARGLRNEAPDRYVLLADEVEAHLAEEIAAIEADDLGRIDTFRTEERRILEAAIADLLAGRFAAADEKAGARTLAGSFWLKRDRDRRAAWDLVGQAAAFGRLMADRPRPLAAAAGHEDAAALYAEQAAPVDAAHRAFEQLRSRHLSPAMPNFADLKTVEADLRRRYRQWADTLARDFTRVCRDNGFLPSATLQQRALFDQVVHPLVSETTGGGRVAVLAVDALRYEMAQALADDLRGPGLTVDLKPRYAELPTLTAVGMNVLAPVAQGGRLSPVLSGGKVTGFRTGEFTVKDPESRARAMGERSTGQKALMLTVQQVVDEPLDTLKRRIAQARLVLVHGREIDDAGEADLGLATFEQSLSILRAACAHLLDAGVKHLVITADHGFLLIDSTVTPQAFGTKREPNRRHIFSDQPRSGEGLVPVPLADLGWDGVGGYVLLRDDTMPFDTGGPSATFAHGGNSPQERLIPVLTVTRRREKPVARNAYAISATALAPAHGCARLRLRLDTPAGANEALSFAAPGRVELALRVPGRDDVRVVLKEAGNALVDRGRLLLRPGREAADILFQLEGSRDERVRVEVWHPDASEAIEAVEVEAWFDVAGTGPARPAGAPLPQPAADWASAIADEGPRRVFLHIGEHGVVDEAEMNRLLGSPRAVRRFALAFESWLPLLPFRVITETTERGKRYVKQTGD